MRTPDAREEVMQLRINQARAANTFATDYLSMFGITRHFRQNFACPVSLNTFVPVFTTGPGYYVVGISALGLPGGAGGHALGVDMFAQKLFDPNFGEATFPNAQSMRQCFMLLFRLFYINLHGQAAVERYF
jgi:hypothetical protein